MLRNLRWKRRNPANKRHPGRTPRTRLPRLEQLERRDLLAVEVPLFGDGTFASLNADTDELIVRVGPNVLTLDRDVHVTAKMHQPQLDITAELSLDEFLQFRSQSTRHTEFFIPNAMKNIFVKNPLLSSEARIELLRFEVEQEPPAKDVAFLDLRARELLANVTADGNVFNESGELLVGQRAKVNVKASNFGIPEPIVQRIVDLDLHLGTDQLFVIKIDFGDGSDPVVKGFNRIIVPGKGLTTASETADAFDVSYAETGTFTVTVGVFEGAGDEAAGFTASGNALASTSIVVNVREPDFLGEGRVLVGENSLLEINRFDTVFVQSLDDVAAAGPLNPTANYQVHFGAIQGRVRNHPKPADLVFEAQLIHDTGDRLPETRQDPVQVTVAQLVPGALIDGANMRFLFNLDGMLGGTTRVLDDLFVGFTDLPHVRNRELSFVLLDAMTGQELDRIRLSGQDLERLNVLGQPVVGDSGQLNRPLDIDVLPASEIVMFRENDGVAILTTEVIAEHVLENLEGQAGEAILTLDYGDGTPVKTVRFDVSAADGGLVVPNTREGAIDPANPLLPEITLDNAVFVPTSNFRNSRFEHPYLETGEYLINATLSLPNGRVAADQVKVRVISDRLVPRPDNLQTTVVHNGPGQAGVVVRGNVRDIAFNQEVNLTLHIGDAEFPTSQLLSGNFFQVGFPGVNLFDLLLPAGSESGEVNDVFLTVSGQNLFPVTVDLGTLAVASQAIEFISESFNAFFNQFEFSAVGDEFELRVPHKDPNQPDEPAEVRTVTSATPVFDNAIPPNRVLADVGAVVMSSFFEDAATGEQMLINSRTFSIQEVIRAPRIVLRRFPDEIREGVLASPPVEVVVRNIPGGAGNVTLRVENGDGTTVERQVTLTDKGDASEFIPTIYGTDPIGKKQDFDVNVEVIRNAEVLASLSRSIVVTDVDPLSVGFNPEQTLINPDSGLFRLSGNLFIDDRSDGGGHLHDVTVHWRDGVVETFTDIGTAGTGSLEFINLSHNYAFDSGGPDFAKRLFDSAFNDFAFQPKITVTRDDGKVATINIPVDLATRLEVAGTDHPDLAFGTVRQGETGGLAFEVPALKVFDDQPFDLQVTLPFQISSTLLNLGVGETVDFSIRTETFTVGFLRFTGVSGITPRVEFLSSDNDQPGSVVSAVEYNRFTGLINLRNPQTLVPLLSLPVMGIHSLEFVSAGDVLANDPGTFGRIQVASYPRIDVRVDENGAIDAEIRSGTGAEFTATLLDPRTGNPHGPHSSSDDDNDDSTFVRIDDAFAGQFGDGGEVHVIVRQNVFGRAETMVMPIRLAEFVTQPILITDADTGRPPVIRRGQGVKLHIQLSEETRALANNPPDDGFELQVDKGDNSELNVVSRHLLRTPGMANNVFRLSTTMKLPDGALIFDFVDLPYDPLTGIITTQTPLEVLGGGELPLRYNEPGLFDLRVFGEGAFGNTIVNVENLGISVVPELAVDNNGRLIGVVNVVTLRNAALKVLQSETAVEGGRQQIQVDVPDSGLQPGDKVDVQLITGEHKVEVNADVNREGNRRPKLDEVNIVDEPDGSKTIEGRTTDEDGDTSEVKIESPDGDEVGQATPDIDGAFAINIPANQIPAGGKVILEVDDQVGGRQRLLLDLFLEIQLFLFPVDHLPLGRERIPLFDPFGVQLFAGAAEDLVAAIFSQDGQLSMAGSDDPPSDTVNLTGTPQQLAAGIQGLQFTPAFESPGTAKIGFRITNDNDPTPEVETEIRVPVIEVEEPPFGGDITVTFINGKLTVTGDNEANALQFFMDNDGNQVIQGFGGTTINGSSDPFVIPAGQEIMETEERLLDGSDRVLIEGILFRGDGTFVSTPGNDELRLTDVTFEGDLNIDLGAEDDILELVNVTVAGTSVLNVGTGVDTVTGSDGDDIIQVEDVDDTIDGGAGFDTLEVLGAGHTIDLSLLAGNAFRNLEAIDVSGSGGGELQLGPADVLAIAPGTGELTVISDGDDMVQIGSGWTLVGTELVDDQFVRFLVQDDAKLRMIGPREFTNPANPLDVNGNGLFEPLDILLIINELNTRLFSVPLVPLAAVATLGNFPGVFIDVNADGELKPDDVIFAVNAFNNRNASGEGESQAAPPVRDEDDRLSSGRLPNTEDESEVADLFADAITPGGISESFDSFRQIVPVPKSTKFPDQR